MTDDQKRKRDWAQAYLRSRFYRQNLHINPRVKFTVEHFISVNLPYVLRNIRNGHCKSWNELDDIGKEQMLS